MTRPPKKKPSKLETSLSIMSLLFPFLRNLGKTFYHFFLPLRPSPISSQKTTPLTWFFCRFCRGRRLRRQAPPTKWELQQPGLYVRLLWAKVTQRNLAMGSSARCRVKRYAYQAIFVSNAAMGKSTQPWGNTTRSTCRSQCDF